MKSPILLLALMAFTWTSAPSAAAPQATASSESKAHKSRAHKPVAKKQRGKASYYSRKFAGKKMADGTPMNPRANVAASKTLPIGTKAKVKNLETGKSTEVVIKDRGPFVKGRIIDLSPKAAEQLDMKEDGVAPVEVTPLEIPQPRGTPEDMSASGK